MPRKFNRRAFRRAVWTSLARLIGVGFGAGAGSLIYKLIGGGTNGWYVAALMVIVSFALMTFAEYEKELEP
jgi:predicted MFS family arabinose efflux permease